MSRGTHGSFLSLSNNFSSGLIDLPIGLIDHFILLLASLTGNVLRLAFCSLNRFLARVAKLAAFGLA